MSSECFKEEDIFKVAVVTFQMDSARKTETP